MKEVKVETTCNMYPDVFDETPEDNYDYILNPYSIVMANNPDNRCVYCRNIRSLHELEDAFVDGIYYDQNEPSFDFWSVDLMGYDQKIVLRNIKYCPYCGKKLGVHL